MGLTEASRPPPAPCRAGVFAAGDVMDRKWRQAVTSAGAGGPAGVGRLGEFWPLQCGCCSVPAAFLPLQRGCTVPGLPNTRPSPAAACAGCIAAIEAQHFLQSNQDGADTSFIGQTDLNAAWVAQMQQEAQERQASGDKVGGDRVRGQPGGACAVGWVAGGLGPECPVGCGRCATHSPALLMLARSAHACRLRPPRQSQPAPDAGAESRAAGHRLPAAAVAPQRQPAACPLAPKAHPV